MPQSLREGGYGVGATKWEVTKNLVLPNAFAGILTGTILSLSRAIGETAPLILVGAFYGTFFTTGSADFFEKFDTTYTALPQVDLPVGRRAARRVPGEPGRRRDHGAARDHAVRQPDRGPAAEPLREALVRRCSRAFTPSTGRQRPKSDADRS